MKKQEEPRILEYCKYLDKRITESSFKIGNIRYFEIDRFVDKRFCQLRNVPKEDCRAFKKIMIQEIVIMTNKNNLLRSDNSLALTTDKKFVSIIQFILCGEENEQCVVCNKINVRQDFENCTYINKFLGLQDNIQIIETTRLKKLCVLVESISETYLSVAPYAHVIS